MTRRVVSTRPRRRSRRGSAPESASRPMARKKSDRVIAAWIFRSGGSPTWSHGPGTSGTISVEERSGAVIGPAFCTVRPSGGSTSLRIGAGRGTIGTRRSQRRMPCSRMRAITRRPPNGCRSAAPTTERTGSGRASALQRGGEGEVVVGAATQRDRDVEVLAGLTQTHVVAAVDGEERRHVERLVDLRVGRRRRAARGSSGVGRRCCAPRRRSPGDRPSGP